MKKDLKNLLTEISECRLCEDHLPLGARPVLQFNSSAKILLVGQAPGTKVHETGIPFNDPSGERLRDWMGVERETFYDSSKFAIVPMGFCYPGKGKSGDLPPRSECAEAWREKLFNHSANIELTLLIGQYAQKYHLGALQKSNLTETVKFWKEYLPKGILPLPHPSPRNNIWLRKNSWFEKEVLPVLKSRVKSVLNNCRG